MANKPIQPFVSNRAKQSYSERQASVLNISPELAQQIDHLAELVESD